MVQTVEVKVLVAKNLLEVGDFAVACIDAVKKGGDITASIGALIPKFIAAVEGADQLDDEVSSDYVIDTGLVIGKNIVKAVLAKTAQE